MKNTSLGTCPGRSWLAALVAFGALLIVAIGAGTGVLWARQGSFPPTRTNVLLAEAHLPRHRLMGVQAPGARLPGADLHDRHLEYARFSGADLDGANLEGACLVATRPDRSRMRQARLAHARLDYADLAEADLSDADLRHTLMRRTGLCHADLRSADFGDCWMDETDLRGADLRGADLSGALVLRPNPRDGSTLVRDPGLPGVKLAGARYDASTRWPPGFQPGRRGAVLVGDGR